jgi:hypothetical protein
MTKINYITIVRNIMEKHGYTTTRTKKYTRTHTIKCFAHPKKSVKLKEELSTILAKHNIKFAIEYMHTHYCSPAMIVEVPAT